MSFVTGERPLTSSLHSALQPRRRTVPSSHSRVAPTLSNLLLACRYQLQNLPAAIASFHRSLALTPATPPSEPPSPDEELDLTPAQLVLADTHTNLGAAYILSTPPRPDLALEHLQEALAINPDDAELVYNLAAVLEATEDLDEALIAYKRAEALGIGRAGGNLRNVSSEFRIVLSFEFLFSVDT